MEKRVKPTKKELFNEEQKKILKNRKVVQLNKFIKGDVSAFSVNDLKIFKLIISKVDSQESLFKDFYEISTDEIKALNIKEKHLYSETRKTLRRLANIYITFDEGESIREVGLIRNDFKFEKYTKKVLINFNKDMDEYLINLKKNFFMYDLIDIVNFKFKHTIKFYEYIKSQSLNVIKLKIDTIKDILDLKNKYSRYANFKKDVLEVILEEINESSNTLYISYNVQKIGPRVEFIIFHVKRIKNNLILEDNSRKNKYQYLIGKECEYLDKFYTLDNVDTNKYIIALKEALTNNFTHIVKDDEKGLEATLKALYKKDFVESGSNEDIEQDEIQRLLTVKDFKKFKEQVIKEYEGKQLGNNLPGFDKEDIISVQNETGYLLNATTGVVIKKEESLLIWRYLYKNRNLVGKIIKDDPTKEFINKVFTINKKNKFGDSEVFKYLVTDIKEEKENGNIKYRLFIQNLNDPLTEIEKSKSLLTFEQLKIYIEENSKKDI
ncbi:replication initiation protein [Poseidonibacter lekithochrous]|uniref:replication initiation protein n=1 Tax=Poseidonibacter TaxID=2321187 RepID=UPI001C07F519|nr:MULTISPECIES: replication initiation protein [Poseidonibacter]MBU3014225.1 replication initiation protein [Poseidonibacter lekithochrous]MDO6827522.1 replication initiation protein [Poseidonibacter sp. 1_MG-2023]